MKRLASFIGMLFLAVPLLTGCGSALPGPPPPLVFGSPTGAATAGNAPTPAPASTAGQTIFVYRGHTQPVQAVAWSPDGTRIASAGDDKTVQVWLAPPAR